MLHFRLQKESSSSGGPKELGYRKRNTRMALSAKAPAVAWPAAGKQASGTLSLPSSDFTTAFWLLPQPGSSPRCKKQQKSSWGLRAAAAQESTRLRCREKSMRRLTALLQLKKGGC
jgi:hypothetical protein